MRHGRGLPRAGIDCPPLRRYLPRCGTARTASSAPPAPPRMPMPRSPAARLTNSSGRRRRARICASSNAAKGAGRGAGPRPVLRPPGPRQDHARPDRGAPEMGVGFRATSGPVIAKTGDLAALLTNLEDGDVLFIDEIHRLSPAGGGGALSGDGGSRARPDDRRGAVGALRPHRPAALHPGRRDHRARGLLTPPLRGPLRHPDPPATSTRWTSWSGWSTAPPRLLGLAMSRRTGRHEIAARSRGTPRIAGRLLRRVRGLRRCGWARRSCTPKMADQSLTRLEVDALGLDAMDRRYLPMIADIYRRRPGGRGDARRRASASRATRSRR